MSNLDGDCMRCLCQASTLCNATVGCSRGYCGPYYVHREYWKDAGQVVLQDDDPDRDQAFVDCAVDAACAQKIVENYMVKWGRVSADRWYTTVFMNIVNSSRTLGHNAFFSFFFRRD